jgi:hypothetical protein
MRPSGPGKPPRTINKLEPIDGEIIVDGKYLSDPKTNLTSSVRKSAWSFSTSIYPQDALKKHNSPSKVKA